jgi:hypothetical protein
LVETTDDDHVVFVLCVLQKIMEERDAERIKRMAIEAAERAAMNAAKKKKAEERIAGASSSSSQAP